MFCALGGLVPTVTKTRNGLLTPKIYSYIPYTLQFGKNIYSTLFSILQHRWGGSFCLSITIYSIKGTINLAILIGQEQVPGTIVVRNISKSGTISDSAKFIITYNSTTGIYRVILFGIDNSYNGVIVVNSVSTVLEYNIDNNNYETLPNGEEIKYELVLN